MPRLFTGIEVPADIGAVLFMKRGGLPGARWIDAENYHITLRFVGDVDQVTAVEISRALEKQMGIAPFRVRLTSLDIFGGRKPRSLFVRIAENAELTRLYAAQERAIQRIGLVPDRRKFIPHITLARLTGVGASQVGRYMSEAGWFEPLEFEVRRFALFSARGAVGGGPYVAERTYDLEG